MLVAALQGIVLHSNRNFGFLLILGEMNRILGILLLEYISLLLMLFMLLRRLLHLDDLVGDLLRGQGLLRLLLLGSGRNRLDGLAGLLLLLLLLGHQFLDHGLLHLALSDQLLLLGPLRLDLLKHLAHLVHLSHLSGICLLSLLGLLLALLRDE